MDTQMETTLRRTTSPESELTLGVVTISFNQARFLTEAIESVQMADRSRLRYVIVDPGSTDGSREIIEAHRDRFSSVIFEPDRGPSDGLNKGFDQCDAEVLGYINADDRFMPGALDWVLRYFERHPEVEGIIGAVAMMGEDGHLQFRRRVPWNYSPQNILDRCALYLQQGTFFRRSAWEKVSGFNVENRTCWDAELALDMALAGVEWKFVPKCLGAFRLYDTSLCGRQLLANDSELWQKRMQDSDRMAKKIMDAGLVRSPNFKKKLKLLSYQLHPVRRLLELSLR